MNNPFELEKTCRGLGTNTSTVKVLISWFESVLLSIGAPVIVALSKIKKH